MKTSKCYTCQKAITKDLKNNPKITCDNESCKKCYHFNCNLSVSDKKALLTVNSDLHVSWFCQECKEKYKRIRVIGYSSSDVVNLELQTLIESCSTKLDDLEQKITTYDDKIKRIDDIIANYDILKTKVRNLEQKCRLNNIEISGIPERRWENLFNIVCRMGQVLGCPLNKNDIDIIHRVASVQHGILEPKIIIVRFVSRWKRNNFVSNAKAIGNLTSSKFGFFESNNVHINDNLIPENKMLLNNCKTIAMSKNYKYVWVKDFEIFVRKKDSSPIIIIKTSDDLAKIN